LMADRTAGVEQQIPFHDSHLLALWGFRPAFNLISSYQVAARISITERSQFNPNLITGRPFVYPIILICLV
ncbi:MAG: hypothetical protein ACE5F6_14450, partial [Anaerolineae bacterium]